MSVARCRSGGVDTLGDGATATGRVATATIVLVPSIAYQWYRGRHRQGCEATKRGDMMPPLHRSALPHCGPITRNIGPFGCSWYRLVSSGSSRMLSTARERRLVTIT